MRTAAVALGTCALSVAAACTSVTAAPHARNDAVRVYAAVRTRLLAATSVPVLLPRALGGLPAGLTATISLARHDVYDVSLDVGPDCAGSPVCHLGHVEGERVTKAGAKPLGREIRLRDGRRAEFLPATCAASCSDATLTWTAGRATYTIGLVDGHPAELRALAESMRGL